MADSSTGRWRSDNRPEGWFKSGRDSSAGTKSGTELRVVTFTLKPGSNLLCDVGLVDRQGKEVFHIADEDASWYFIMEDA